jgi:type I restriction enzyme S subunit
MPINSILIAMYGGWEQIGRTSIIKKEAATNQAITCLFNPKKEMNADYVQLVLQQYRYKWKQYAVSTRKDPNITKTDIKNFILAFPIDVKEQDKIVDRIMKTKDFVSKSKIPKKSIDLFIPGIDK